MLLEAAPEAPLVFPAMVLVRALAAVVPAAAPAVELVAFDFFFLGSLEVSFLELAADATLEVMVTP